MASNSTRIDLLARNIAPGGGLDFWQRNTTFTTPANNTYTADRFVYIKSGTATNTITQETSILPLYAQSGFNSTYSLKVVPVTTQASPSATDFYGLGYRLEGQDFAHIHQGSARIQFWVRCSVTGTYGLSLQNSAQTRTYAATFTVNAANTWEKKTFDISLDTAGTWLLDNNVGLRVHIILTAGSSQQISAGSWQTTTAGTYAPTGLTNTFQASGANTFYITQFMIVPGSYDSGTDIPFQRAGRTIGDELRMCQRYYYQFQQVNTGFRPISRIVWYDANAIYFAVKLPTSLRSTPTLVGTAGTDLKIRTVTSSENTGWTFGVSADSTQDNIYMFASKSAHGLTDAVLSSENSVPGFSAEL